MDSRTIRFLADCNSIVNGKMNGHLKDLDEAMWTRKFGGYFNSVRALCNHLYIADFNWLRRFSGLREFRYIKDDFFKASYPFGSHAFGTVGEYLRMREEIDSHLKLFAAEVTDEDPGKTLRYIDSHGDEHLQEFGLVVLHVFNHQTHHRGMISIYLEEMGIANGYSDIMDII